MVTEPGCMLIVMEGGSKLGAAGYISRSNIYTLISPLPLPLPAKHERDEQIFKIENEISDIIRGCSG